MKAFLARALVFAFPCLAVGQIATLQIKVLEGEGAVHPGGARISRPLTVQVTDEAGRPVPGAAVSFQLPPEGPGGLFSNGLRTDLAITDASGRVSIHSIQLNRAGGQFRIRITAVKEQARAGIVSFQYINDKGAAPAAVAAAPAGQKAAGHSPGITPTTAKMGRRIGKKWIVLGALAAGAGVAAVGVSHAAGSQKSSAPSSTVSIGTPTITIGNPNQ